MLGSDEGIKLVSTDGKLLGTILGYLSGITLEIDVVIELYSLNVPFGGYNDVNLEGLLL